jgi:hypothetical protein
LLGFRLIGRLVFSECCVGFGCATCIVIAFGKDGHLVISVASRDPMYL